MTDPIEIEVDVKDTEAKRKIKSLQNDLDKTERSTGKMGTANRRMADEGERKVVPFIRKYRWGLSLLLITQNALYRLAQGTKILASMLNLLTKALGFLIDMALLPFVPLIIMAAIAIFRLGEWLNNLPEPLKTISNLLIGGTVAILLFGIAGSWIVGTLGGIYTGILLLIGALPGLFNQLLVLYATLMMDFTAMGLLGQAAVILGALLVSDLLYNIILASGAMDSLHDSIYGGLEGLFTWIESLGILGGVVEQVIKTFLSLGLLIHDIFTGRWEHIIADMNKLQDMKLSEAIGTPGQTWKGIQEGKTESETANSIARARQSTWGTETPVASGSAPQSSLTSIGSQGNINVSNLNLTLNQSVTNNKQLFDELLKEFQKSYGRNVTPVRT